MMQFFKYSLTAWYWIGYNSKNSYVQESTYIYTWIRKVQDPFKEIMHFTEKEKALFQLFTM